jgi:hypothetical protein
MLETFCSSRFLQMGRPSGTTETILSKEDVLSCAGRVEISQKINDLVTKDAVKLFSKASSPDVVISRQILGDSLWILETLVVASPVNIVHTDSYFD